MLEQSNEITRNSATTSTDVLKFALAEVPQNTYISGEKDATNRMNESEDTSLSNFLSRPILLFSRNFGIGEVVSDFYNPVNLFLGDPRICNRISNFAYIQATLHLRVTTTGTPFHFGKIVLSYDPWPDYGLQRYQPASLLTARQRMMLPHVCIDPSREEAGELAFELIHPFNGLDMTTLLDQTPASISLFNLVPLAATSPDATSIFVNVYAWMTDVTLMVPTSVNCDLLTEQSGEYTTTSVSGISSIMASRLGAIGHVPIIGKYAMATQMITNGIGQLASLFGYSRPNILPALHLVRNSPTSELATYNNPDCVNKLTLDMKQETTIDPRVIGLSSKDEMVISDIAKREFYLHGFPWTYAQAYGSRLHGNNVSPTMVNIREDDTIELSPSAFVSAPFKYWRGTMYFRIEIVGNAFHRGKLRLIWDPLNTDPTGNYNVTYSHVIDISESRNYEFCVGWGTNKPYLLTAPLTEHWGLAATIAELSPDFSNGYLTVRVEAPLVSNDNSGTSTSGVSVLIFTRMGDDFEVAEPQSYNISDLTPYGAVAQSRILTEQSALMESPLGVGINAQAETELCLNGLEPDVDLGTIASIHFGERVVSIRQLLKRYCHHSAWSGFNAESGHYRHSLVMNDFPFYRGNDTFISTDSDRNVCNITYLNWFTPAFLAYRGGIRWKYAIAGSLTASTGNLLAVTRTNAVGLSWEESSININPLNRNSVNVTQAITAPNIRLGGAISHLDVNKGIEFEVPYYSPTRFRFAQFLERTGAEFNNYINNQTFHRLSIDHVATTTQPFIYNRYCAASDDFQLYFFKYTPLMRRVAL